MAENEHAIINVEAAIAKRLWDEATDTARQAHEAQATGRALLEQAEQATDPLEQHLLRRQADEQLRRVHALTKNADGMRKAARNTVKRALSLPDDTDLDQLEPERSEPVTPEWEEQRRRDAHEAAWRQLRADRNALLTATDWTQLPDVDGETRAAYVKYRQQLRDLPANTTDPAQPDWPKAPGSK